jgi:hypothetical protein
MVLIWLQVRKEYEPAKRYQLLKKHAGRSYNLEFEQEAESRLKARMLIISS